MSNVNKLHDAYYQAFGDKALCVNVIAVVKEIKSGKWPNDTPMGMYSVGEIININGWYASNLMIQDMIAAYTGRAIKFLCQALNIDPYKDFAAIGYLIADTEAQTQRCIEPIRAALVKAYGQPSTIDENKIAELVDRAKELLQNLQTH